MPSQTATITYRKELTPPALIDLFLHGRNLHTGNERSDLAAFPLGAACFS